MKIIAILGSLRTGSYNRRLLELIRFEGEKLELKIELISINSIPIFSEDIEKQGIPEEVQTLSNKIKSSDGVIIATPEYNGISPGSLLNALDWLSLSSVGKPLLQKPVGVVGASTGGFGAIKAQTFLISHCLNLKMIPYSINHLRVSYIDKLLDDQEELQLKFIPKINEYLFGFRKFVDMIVE